MAIYEEGELPGSDIKDKLETHINQIDRQVAQLLLLRQHLTDVLNEWNVALTLQNAKICPNLDI